MWWALIWAWVPSMPWLLVRVNGWAPANQLGDILSGPHCVRKYWKKLEVAVAALAVGSERVV